MTDLRKAAQQALEAHRMLRNWIKAVPQEVVLPAMPGIDGDWLDEVERNLRAELDQQQAEPVQEPFGYLWPTGSHPEFRFTQQKRDGADGMPLYTTPPKRKPLTDEQISKIWDDTPALKGDPFFLRFTRAIEAAHGIQEPT